MISCEGCGRIVYFERSPPEITAYMTARRARKSRSAPLRCLSHHRARDVIEVFGLLGTTTTNVAEYMDSLVL